MNDATKRTADAPPAGEDAPIAKKPSVELFQNEADKKVAVVTPTGYSAEHCNRIYTPRTEHVEHSSTAVEARNLTTLTCSTINAASSSRNEPAETATESNGNGPGSPLSMPASYQKYQPLNNYSNVNLLDYHFFHLNDMLFHNARQVSFNLFQAGRKQNFGFLDNRFTMIYLPARPADLANWLECFNRGASIKPAGVEQEGYTHYTWQSVVTLPRSNFTQNMQKKYQCHEKPGFTDAPIIEDHSSYPAPLPVKLEDLFPAIAVLAGLRKGKRVPKGWFSFSRDDDTWRLSICKGNAQSGTGKLNRPKGLAFEGESQHEPVERPLFQISGRLEIRGLHDLFCVVEGLLRTL